VRSLNLVPLVKDPALTHAQNQQGSAQRAVLHRKLQHSYRPVFGVVFVDLTLSSAVDSRIMSGGLHLSHKLDFSAVAFASERQSLLLASLAAPQITGRSNRPPVDLVAVLDRFSSLTTLALQTRLVSPQFVLRLSMSSQYRVLREVHQAIYCLSGLVA